MDVKPADEDLKTTHQGLKPAPAACRQSGEETYRTLVEMSPDPIVIAQDGLIKLANRAYTEVFGPAEEEIENGLGFLEFIQEKDRALARQRYEDRMAGKNVPVNLEIDLITKNDGIVPFETASAVVQFNGRPANMVIIRDITRRRGLETARKQAHDVLEARVAKRTAELKKTNKRLIAEIAKQKKTAAALRQSRTRYRDLVVEIKKSEKKFRSLVETTSDWVWEVDTDGVYTHANSKVKEILGYDINEIIGTCFFDHLIVPERPQTRAFFKKKCKESTPFIGWKITQTHKNGHPMMFEVNGAPVFDDQGKLSHWQGFNRDITEKVMGEQALRESEEKYRNLVELSPDPVMIVQDDRHRFINTAFTWLFGYTLEEMETDFTLLDLVPEPDKDIARRNYTAHLSGGNRPKTFVIDLITKDDRTLTCQLSAVRIQYAGKPAILATIRDITEQKQAERALQEREQRLALVTEATTEGIWDWDMVHKRLYVSPRCAEITGFDFSDVEIDIWSSRLHPEDKAQVMQRLEDHLKNKTTYEVEYRYRHEDGHYIWLSAYGMAVFDEKGVPHRMVGSIRDVTGRKQAEEELRESEARLRQLSEATWEAIIIHDRGVLLHANPQFYDMFGYDAKKLIGTKALYKAITPGAVRDVLERIEKNRVDPYEVMGMKEDGTEFPTEVRVKTMDYYGRTVRVAAIRDLGNQKEAEAALRDSETRYRLLFENAGTAIQVFDPNGICLMMNEMAAGFYNGTPDDFIGKSFFDLHPADADKYVRRIRDIMTSGKGRSFEERVVSPTDKKTWVLSNVVPVMDSTGRTYAVQIISQDISRSKAAEKQIHTLTHQLIAAQENERQRISRELHDRVAQDLSTARIICRLLVGNQMIPADARQRITEISQTLQTTIGSVRDLSYFLRPPGLEKLGLVHAILQHCNDFTGKSGVEVDFHAAGMDDLTLGFDKAINLYRVIQEALNNIWKHANAQKATVRLVASHPKIILRIEDNGSGFDKQDRMVTAMGEKRMGLRSMQERIGLLRGKMDIQSRPAKGTKILIEVPFDEVNHPKKGRRTDHR